MQLVEATPSPAAAEARPTDRDLFPKTQTRDVLEMLFHFRIRFAKDGGSGTRAGDCG